MSTGQIQWFAGEILKSLLPKSCIFQTGLSKNRPQIITMISSDHWYQKYLKYSEKHHKCVFCPANFLKKLWGFHLGIPTCHEGILQAPRRRQRNTTAKGWGCRACRACRACRGRGKEERHGAKGRRPKLVKSPNHQKFRICFWDFNDFLFISDDLIDLNLAGIQQHGVMFSRCVALKVGGSISSKAAFLGHDGCGYPESS